MLPFLVGHHVERPLEKRVDCPRELVGRRLAPRQLLSVFFRLELPPARLFSHDGRRRFERVRNRGRLGYASGRIAFRMSFKGWRSAFPSVFFAPFSTPSRMFFRSPP